MMVIFGMIKRFLKNTLKNQEVETVLDLMKCSARSEEQFGGIASFCGR